MNNITTHKTPLPGPCIMILTCFEINLIKEYKADGFIMHTAALGAALLAREIHKSPS